MTDDQTKFRPTTPPRCNWRDIPAKSIAWRDNEISSIAGGKVHRMCSEVAGMKKYQGGLTEAPTIGAYLPHNVARLADTICPRCSMVAVVVWRGGGIFHQRTECSCGRKTRWVVCGHDGAPDTTDDESEEGRG